MEIFCKIAGCFIQALKGNHRTFAGMFEDTCQTFTRPTTDLIPVWTWSTSMIFWVYIKIWQCLANTSNIQDSNPKPGETFMHLFCVCIEVYKQKPWNSTQIWSLTVVFSIVWLLWQEVTMTAPSVSMRWDAPAWLWDWDACCGAAPATVFGWVFGVDSTGLLTEERLSVCGVSSTSVTLTHTPPTSLTVNLSHTSFPVMNSEFLIIMHHIFLR